MTTIKIICSLVFITSLFFDGIYDFSVPATEGGSQPLSAYQGKKMMIITLPVTQSASADSLLASLDSLASANTDSLAVIAVPSIEDGYNITDSAALRQWYRSKLGNGVLVTSGLFTHKASAGQHGLFKWLTSVEQNMIFDIDAAAPGYKYFIRKTGELYGVLNPETTLGSHAINTVINAQ